MSDTLLHGDITERIEALAVNRNILLPRVNRRSVTVIASKIGADNGRMYRTKAENDDVRVWRLK